MTLPEMMALPWRRSFSRRMRLAVQSATASMSGSLSGTMGSAVSSWVWMLW